MGQQRDLSELWGTRAEDPFRGLRAGPARTSPHLDHNSRDTYLNQPNANSSWRTSAHSRSFFQQRPFENHSLNSAKIVCPQRQVFARRLLRSTNRLEVVNLTSGVAR